MNGSVADKGAAFRRLADEQLDATPADLLQHPFVRTLAGRVGHEHDPAGPALQTALEFPGART